MRMWILSCEYVMRHWPLGAPGRCLWGLLGMDVPTGVFQGPCRRFKRNVACGRFKRNVVCGRFGQSSPISNFHEFVNLSNIENCIPVNVCGKTCGKTCGNCGKPLVIILISTYFLAYVTYRYNIHYCKNS